MKLGLIITGGRLNLTFAGQFLEKTSVDCVISVDGRLDVYEKAHRGKPLLGAALIDVDLRGRPSRRGQQCVVQFQ